MKFTKTVADALANKVLQQLQEARKKFLDEFTLPEEESVKLKALIAERFAITGRLKELDEELSKIALPSRAYCDTPELLYNRYVRCVGEKAAKPLPSRSTLSDDFLIEALDSENAEELIAKVAAKYSIQFFSYFIV